MPDKYPSHHLFLQWGAVRIGAAGIPAIFVILIAEARRTEQQACSPGPDAGAHP